MNKELGVINDAIFSYSFISLLFYLLTPSIDIYQISVYSFILTTLLAYIEPFDNIVRRIAIRNIIKMGGKPKTIFEKSYNSSYLENLRLKVKTGFYVIIILLAIILLNRPQISPILFCLTIVAIIGTICKIAQNYYSNLIYGILAVSWYLVSIKESEPMTWNLENQYRLSTLNISYLEKTREALENENWLEALGYLAKTGIPEKVIIPEQILDEVWKYTEKT